MGSHLSWNVFGDWRLPLDFAHLIRCLKKSSYFICIFWPGFWWSYLTFKVTFHTKKMLNMQNKSMRSVGRGKNDEEGARRRHSFQANDIRAGCEGWRAYCLGLTYHRTGETSNSALICGRLGWPLLCAVHRPFDHAKVYHRIRLVYAWKDLPLYAPLAKCVFFPSAAAEAEPSKFTLH
jgi:hypothetical protein